MTSTTLIPQELVRTTVKLTGEDGNAFSILGLTKRALKKAGNSQAVVDAYMEQATSGDYNHLLAVTMQFADVA